MMFSIKLFAQG